MEVDHWDQIPGTFNGQTCTLGQVGSSSISGISNYEDIVVLGVPGKRGDSFDLSYISTEDGIGWSLFDQIFDADGCFPVFEEL